MQRPSEANSDSGVAKKVDVLDVFSLCICFSFSFYICVFSFSFFFPGLRFSPSPLVSACARHCLLSAFFFSFVASLLFALCRCLEGLSRQRYSHSALVDACVACAEQHGQAFPLHDTLRAVAAARRLDLGGIEEPLRRSGMADKVNRATDRGDQLLALLRHLDLLRLRDSQLLQKVSEAVELHSQKAAFLATQLPEALLHLTRLAPADLRLPVALLSQPSLLAMAPRLSAAQLQQLLSASALVLFQHIQRREGGQGGDPLIAREAEALAKTVERFLDLLQPQFLSLNLRDRRALKEAASLFLVEAQGAAKRSFGSTANRRRSLEGLEEFRRGCWRTREEGAETKGGGSAVRR
ncbi:putative transmembrane protein [Toxoplasma gondii CAST]|uniref:Putative transmembrane protein n=1 Tax=Toxoplasma gondii CAST TaxID=943122 RepID=A0A425I839_TOXGO|nr:putative transmembrane protein [Toxoplasma gondii CAST]